MQIKFTNDKKARVALGVAALMLFQLFALRSCSGDKIEFAPLIDPAYWNTASGWRDIALMLAIAIFTAFALFFLLRVIRLGAKADKVMLASLSGVAIYSMLMVPPDIKAPSPAAAPASKEVLYLDGMEFCDMSCYDGGGPALPQPSSVTVGS